MDTEANQLEIQNFKPLAVRVRHIHWIVRKTAYQQILTMIEKVSSISEQFKINNEFYTVGKVSSFVNNLVEQKHPNVLLKGFQCVQAILKLDSTTSKQFNKLVVQGLEKFPHVTQQRKIILEKFLEILQLCNIEPSILSNRLSLPNEKSVMFVIEVIGALGINSLRGKLIELTKKHPKKDVKELAAQIANQLCEQQQPIKRKQEEVKGKLLVKGPNKKEGGKVLRMDLIDKLPHFEQLTPKKQQQYSEELLEYINEISLLSPNGPLSSFGYYVQLMIQFNNQIVSTNGIKMLTVLIINRSQLLNQSFPLLFIFRKFKMHKTHSTNNNLFGLVEVLLCSPRSNDLMNAIIEGIGSNQNKVNMKYGCIMSFIRVFCYYYKQQELFSVYCIGEYKDLYEKIQGKRYIQKTIAKCFDIFSREKDKQYLIALQKMRQVLGITNLQTQKSTKDIKEISKDSNQIIKNKSSLAKQDAKVKQPIKTFIASKSTKSINSILTPEGQLNKILQILQLPKFNRANLEKAIDRCLKCSQNTLNQNIYDLFYFCQIADSFIQNYEPNEETDEIVSHFLIDYLKLLSTMDLKPSKKQSKITQTGLQYFFKLSIGKLVLSKELISILNNINTKFGFELIVKCLASLYVMGNETMKKKNKKYLIKWLEENASEQCIDNNYFEVKEAIEANGEKKKIKPYPHKQTEQENAKVINSIRNPIVKSTKKLQQQPKIQAQQQQYELQHIKKEENSKPIMKQSIEKLQILENADISQIQNVQQPSTDRMDDKWDYFLSKKMPVKQQYQHYRDKEQNLSEQQEQKFNYQEQEQEQVHNHYQQKNQFSAKKYLEEKYTELQEDNVINNAQNKLDDELKYNDKNTSQFQKQSQEDFPESKQSQFQYQFLNYEKIKYMINNSTNPFNHLRTLILLPFKSQINKQSFLRQLTHIIQSQTLNKPQPFNSILLIVILLFTEIKSDKKIIQPLQYLYEYMAQHCTNNQFLKIIIGLYHCVIDQTQQNERKLLLTILTKSMTRIMPFVENALELLKDFQQFYQIGEMVYFQMFSEEYSQIKQVIEHSDSLQQVIRKAYEQQGESLIPIIQGWLQTSFKIVVKQTLNGLLQEQEQAF